MRFRIRGAAIHAAEIAAVCDRHAQVGDPAAEFISKQHSVFAPAKQKAQIRVWIWATHPARTCAPDIPLSKHGRPGRFHPHPQLRCFAERRLPANGISPRQVREVGEFKQSLPSRRGGSKSLSRSEYIRIERK